MAGDLNRALVVYENWEAQERELRKMPELAMSSKEMMLAKLDFLTKGIYRVGIDPSPREKLALGVLKGVTPRLQKKLYPGLLLRTAVRLKAALLDKPGYIRSFLKLRSQNLMELEALLKSRGIAQHGLRLEHHLDFERGTVQLDWKANLDATTSLKLDIQLYKDKSGAYKLDQVEAWLKHEQQPEKDRKFPFNEQFNVDAVKMVNLLMGRAVLNGPAEMNHYATNQWLQLGDLNGPHYADMRVFQPEQGFDLKAVLNDFAGQTGFYRATAADVYMQLLQGQQIRISGKHPHDEPVFLEASPGTGGLVLRDRNQKEIGIDEVLAGTHALRKEAENGLTVQLNVPEENKQQDQSRGLGS